jgi:hypothetical protein
MVPCADNSTTQSAERAHANSRIGNPHYLFFAILGIVLWTIWSLKTWDRQAPQQALAFMYMRQAWSLVVTPLALFALIVKPYR